MRMLMHVKLPNDMFNDAVRDGSVGSKLERILAETRAEHVFFTEYDGHRGAILIVNVSEPSKVPGLAEPWFLLFNGHVTFHIVMTPEDLGKAGLDALAKKWSA